MAKTTIMDVAQRAGVSYATVSRFINGNPHVSPAAAEAIRDAIAQTGYVPNNAARSLVMRRTHVIAFVMHGEAASITTDPNVNTILVATNEAVGAAGYQLVSLIADSPEATARIEAMARAGFADGWILNSMHIDDPLLVTFAKLGLPAAVSGASYRQTAPDANGKMHDGPASAPLPCVDIDNRAAFAELTQYVRGMGHRRIACIAGPDYIPCANERLEGFQEAMGADFDSTLVVRAKGWGHGDGVEAVRKLLAADITSSDGSDTDSGEDNANRHPLDTIFFGFPRPRPHFDALMCANDCIAAGALAELTAQGMAVPQDVAVTGFDDSPDASASHPAITTVRQPIARFGEELAELVLAQIEGREPASPVWLDTQLVPRESA